jgi:hypothetical protein
MLFFGSFALYDKQSCPSKFSSCLSLFPSFLAGFVAWLASPIAEASCVEFYRGLGEVLYVGTGAMIVWATPLVEFYGPRVSRVPEFWVMVSVGTTEEKEGAGMKRARMQVEMRRIRIRTKDSPLPPSPSPFFFSFLLLPSSGHLRVRRSCFRSHRWRCIGGGPCPRPDHGPFPLQLAHVRGSHAGLHEDW